MSEENKESIRDRVAKKYRVGNLTLGRFAEIQAAQEEGRHIEVTDEERAKYERQKPKISPMSRDLLQSYTDSVKASEQYKQMLDQAKQILQQAAPVSVSPSEGYGDVWDRIGDAKREEYQRENRNSENIQAIAEVVKSLVKAMEQEHSKTAEREIEARVSADNSHNVARRSMKIGGWSLAVACLALLAAIVLSLI